MKRQSKRLNSGVAGLSIDGAFKRKFAWSLCSVLIVIGLGACSGASDAEIAATQRAFDYSKSEREAICAPGDKSGEMFKNNEKSADGIRYNIRAPANYDPTVGHPLLVVYAAGGSSAERTEALTGFTPVATKRGYIVVYPDHRPMSVATIHRLARIPSEVADHWCVDRTKIYASGHSDGGTVATAVALLAETKGTLAAIAPSAAGFSAADLDGFECPSPTPVMVMHGSGDLVFPGWGAAAAKWWGKCNRCDISVGAEEVGSGCVEFKGCAAGGQTRFCSWEGSHRQWPGMEGEVVNFFDARWGAAMSSSAPVPALVK
ncbi:PHB depolymerase family esterase [Azoarcus sp. DD4]|uniref:alpha/beta hydrolase family esterase n=1 Tax=Azoarcus sp. DD4 TaxID=2027405 RepID=UPI00112749B8|nr:poly(3-hydroxybutyrate) depolymerase [Azoarcus sp. DD4]